MWCGDIEALLGADSMTLQTAGIAMETCIDEFTHDSSMGRDSKCESRARW
jgi:hypothetical protein